MGEMPRGGQEGGGGGTSWGEGRDRVEEMGRARGLQKQLPAVTRAVGGQFGGGGGIQTGRGPIRGGRQWLAGLTATRKT